MLDNGASYNPLDLTFERKRIFINDFVLPSHPHIHGKTFIECDLIGPANIYFLSNNFAQPMRDPRIDAVWLGPEAKFSNGFIFNNCIFRNCSFQRITLFASIENYESWKINPNINWISISPSSLDIEKRASVLTTQNIQPSVLSPIETATGFKEKFPNWQRLKRMLLTK